MKNSTIRCLIRGVKLHSLIYCVAALAGGLPLSGVAQVNSGSNGSDGVFNPTTNVVINMADHPNGIYHYTSVNIPANVTVTFIPNANNTPVTWLVQDGCVINGTVSVSGQNPSGSQGGLGGPGGYRGGNGLSENAPPTPGQGPGGGAIRADGSYNYGNAFLIPLLGGSGGGGAAFGSCDTYGGVGGGGAILIAASGTISINGNVWASGRPVNYCARSGSGGAIRLVASQVAGNGSIGADGGGPGRIRFDSYDNEFSGGVSGQFTAGFQPIIIPAPGQIPQLTVLSVAGVPVSASPTGVLSTPDAVLSAQQNNPIPIVVQCSNLPLNSTITVTVKPLNASAVSAVGHNTSGSQASSTASVSLNMPRGGGLIYATATTGN